MATTPCMPASGPHQLHHHTDSPCLSPHPFFMLWCGRRDARQLHVCACVCAIHSASSACGCTHLCADLSGGTWLTPSPSSSRSLFHHHIMWRRGKAGGRKQSSHVEQPGGQSSEMTITNRAARWHAMCCWMRMQSTRSTTPVRHLSHLDVPSISSSSQHFPSLSPSRCLTPQRRR